MRLLFHSFSLCRWNKQLVCLFNGEKQWKRCVSWSVVVNSRWRSGSSSFLSLCRAVLGRGFRGFSAILWMSERLCNGSWRHEEPLADRTHTKSQNESAAAWSYGAAAWLTGGVESGWTQGFLDKKSFLLILPTIQQHPGVLCPWALEG